MKKQDLNYVLNKSIVGNRYTFEELVKTVNEFSKQELKIYYSTDELLDNEDFKLDIGGIDSGYGTIWYLPTRNNEMYITEVAYEEEE